MAVPGRLKGRFSLGTLVLLSIFAPPLIALAWFGGIYLWYAASQPLAHLAQSLFFPGMLTSLALAGLSHAYVPGGGTRTMRLTAPQAIGLSGCQFLVLWHWFWISTGLLGWLFIWGDNSSPFIDWIVPCSAILAAVTASVTILRNCLGLATRPYYQIVFALTTVLLLLAAPYWLSRLPLLWS